MKRISKNKKFDEFMKKRFPERYREILSEEQSIRANIKTWLKNEIPKAKLYPNESDIARSMSGPNPWLGSGS